MQDSHSPLSQIKSLILIVLVILTPLFFLPFTQEFFITHKLYLVAFGALSLLLVSTIELLMSKKIVWNKKPFDTGVFLVMVTAGLSILISSPNKVQALLNPNYGLVLVASLGVLYYYISRQKESLMPFLSISGIVVALSTVLFFFQPFKNATLPTMVQFLKNPSFTPVGSYLDLAVFLGFVVAVEVGNVIAKKKSVLSLVSLAVSALGLLLTLYVIFQPNSIAGVTLPPVKQSWFSAVEVLKNPVHALFGVGVDNFASLFTQGKDVTYNQSPLYWQINSFGVSRSTFLHVFSEAGLFGLVALALLVFGMVAKVKPTFKNHFFLPVAFTLIVMLVLPPTFFVFFVFFLLLATITASDKQEQAPSVMNLQELVPMYLGFAVILFIFILGSVYLLGRGYAAEFMFKKSADAFAKNDAQGLYENQRQAVLLNPFIERFHTNFAQTNLLIANNVATRVTQAQKNNPQAQISDSDRQIISQAIQAAINEGKSALALNPQKSTNWEFVASIYRNIINVAQGADTQTVAYYQHAIVLDPQNPLYRLSLGGVYYSLNNFDEAMKMFEQTTALKPDWANAYYNLAWTAFQKGDYPRAVREMQTTLSFLNPAKDQADYARAQSDFETFKKKLPVESPIPTPSAAPKQLSLPTPQPTIEPRVELTPEATPSAK